MKNSIMNIDKRHKDILDILEKKEHMTTLELSEALDVSLSTVRRDLHLLEEKNDIIRKFGYCMFNYENKPDDDHSGPFASNRHSPRRLVSLFMIATRSSLMPARPR